MSPPRFSSLLSCWLNTATAACLHLCCVVVGVGLARHSSAPHTPSLLFGSATRSPQTSTSHHRTREGKFDNGQGREDLPRHACKSFTVIHRCVRSASSVVLALDFDWHSFSWPALVDPMLCTWVVVFGSFSFFLCLSVSFISCWCWFHPMHSWLFHSLVGGNTKRNRLIH